MKTNSPRKTILKAALSLICLSPLIISCSDDSEPETEPVALTSEEVAEIVGGSLAEDAQGLTLQIEEAATLANSAEVQNDGSRVLQTIICDESISESFDRSSQNGAVVGFDFTFSYNYQLTCTPLNLPQQFDFSFEQAGEVDGGRFSSVTTGEGSMLFTGMEITATEYTVAGSYDRQGTHTAKVRNRGIVEFSLELNLEELSLDKGSFEVLSGSGLFSIQGSSPSGAYELNGTLNYLGNQQVEITINDEVFIVDLANGEIIN